MAPRKRKSNVASDVSEADRTCEYCGLIYNNKSGFSTHCVYSECAVQNRGASMWQCFRCSMRSAHRKTIVKHMKEKCWETCEQCTGAELEKCDAAKQEGDCDNCRRSGVACTKLPKGKVTDGDPIEIIPAASSQDEGSESTPPDASYTPDVSQVASRRDPQQLLAAEVSAVSDNNEESYTEIQEDEIIGSKLDETIHKDEKETEGSQDESGQDISVQNTFPNHTDKEQPDITTESPKLIESSREAHSHDTNTHSEQHQTPQIRLTPPDPSQAPSSAMTSIIAQPQIQNPTQDDTTPRGVSNSLSPVDRDFLSGSGTEQNNRSEYVQSQPSTDKGRPACDPDPPTSPAAPIGVITASPPTQVPSLISHSPEHPAQQQPTPSLQQQQQFQATVTPTPVSVSPPWWTSIPEISSALAAQRRRPAPSGLSNDFTAFYASVLEETDHLKKRNNL
ncbi:hypothetical protein PMIN06_004120 [Paraphaeosphaeria minitans]